MQTNLNRREMLATTGKVAILTATVPAAFSLTGCNPTQWINTVLTDLPTIIQIVTQILAIASAAQGGVVNPNLLKEVTEYGDQAKAALQTTQKIITDYQTAVKSAKPGLLTQIDASLNAAQQNLAAILNVFHVSDPTLQSTIAAAVGSAITIVLAITVLIPTPPNPSSAKARLTLSPSDQRAVMQEAYNFIVERSYPNFVIK